MYFIFKLIYFRDFSFQKDLKERVTHLYFTKNIYEAKLKANSEILIMDCTYKSNKYHLPLLSVVGTTCLNTTFYAAFGFLLQERTKDFTWFLGIFQTLYRRLDLEDPKVIVIDRDAALMAAIREIFPYTTNLLCLWHINKCVQAEWKPVF
ncbi:transposase [uncultured Nostoc sp.]|uniref:transposase n=1 Tax=uncultured Nostoc sp. TaxID=340711 RepID=UPI0035C99A2E